MQSKGKGWIAEAKALFGYRELVRCLIAKDLKVKYRGSYLGFLWSLLHPLSLILVYSLVLKYVMDARGIEPLLVITGVIPWVFFANTLTGSTESILSNSNLVKKINFPREILPISTVLFHFAQFLLALLVFIPAVIVLKGGVPATLFFFPVVAALHWLFTLGAALLLSAVTTFYKDVRYLTEVSMMLVFWITPVLYHYGIVAEKGLLSLFRLNPLSPFFFSYQNAVFFERPPLLEHWLTMLAWTGLSLVLGVAIFRRTRDSFAEEL